MSRTRPVEGPTISLFPFLAVLLCTMGALLVLLVLFSRSARDGEDSKAASDSADLQLAKDELSWRLSQLDGVRGRTADDLAKARMQLAGTEDHIRELSDELARLERMLTELTSGGQSRSPDDAEIATLEAQLKSARESLDKTRAELATKPPAYAVVPYVGKNGTHRRPLYIECCIDGVFLQPEGIRLNPSDFEGPPGPGNPLACALRAAREHIARAPGASGDPAAQPYPLLLVRPSGVMAYYAAREAISSWGSEFGYQLIDEDWTLTFPPRDATLAEVEKRAIEESRQRLAWLAEVRPVRAAKPAKQYRAATTRGGVVADGGPSVLGDQSRWNWADQQALAAGPGGRGSGNGNAAGPGSGAGDGPGGAGGGDGAGQGLAGGGSGVAPGRPLKAAGSGGGESASDGPGAGDAILGRSGDGRSGNGRSGTGAAGNMSGDADGIAAGDRYGNGSKFTNAKFGGVAGAAAGGSGATAGADAGGAEGAAGSSAAGSSAGSAFASSAAGGSNGGGSGGQSGMGGGGGAVSMPGLKQAGGSAGQSGGSSGAAASASGSSSSLAQARGRNWASLATQDRPIPLTRPIQIECAADEFRLLDDSGRRVQARIPLSGDTAMAIDPLVKAIHGRVDGWGIAGERMYWKPQLVLSATADGRSRREDLERLLADSGLDTKHKGREDEIRSLPPVRRTSYLSAP
jgi:hypothetical protein